VSDRYLGLTSILDAHRRQLPDDDVAKIMDLFGHQEPELAVELLWHDLIRNNVVLSVDQSGTLRAWAAGSDQDLVRLYEPRIEGVEAVGGDPGSVDALRQTALHRAALHGDAAAIQRLLSAGADVDARDVEGNSPIHLAVRFGRATVIPLLIDAGADIEALDGTGYGPLWWSVMGGGEPIARLLLSRGADPNQIGRDGQTPLGAAHLLGWPVDWLNESVGAAE
jgi:Ankyrin repeats (3 copies)/Ankyrin repeat